MYLIHTCIHTVDSLIHRLVPALTSKNSHMNVYIRTCSPDLLLAMVIAVTMRIIEMVNMKIPAEAIATGTTILFPSIGIWLQVAGI